MAEAGVPLDFPFFAVLSESSVRETAQRMSRFG
jgi:hypothetical protein